MTQDDTQTDSAELLQRLARLHGCMTVLLKRATSRALSLHADAVSVEHLVGAAMQDEDSAAYSVVEHAFADPETIAQELLALSTGIMVVASGSALPFSPLAVDALRAAHARAGGHGEDAGQVDVGAILQNAFEVLPSDTQVALKQMGFEPGDGGTKIEAIDPGDGPQSSGSFFAQFSGPAKAVLSQANRKAARSGEPSIGPGQLILASLEGDPDLQASSGLTVTRARQALSGRTHDRSVARPRVIPPEPELVEFLAALPQGAGSLELLAACHGKNGTPELSELLGRHMVTPALLERCAGAFPDSDEPRE